MLLFTSVENDVVLTWQALQAEWIVSILSPPCYQIIVLNVQEQIMMIKPNWISPDVQRHMAIRWLFITHICINHAEVNYYDWFKCITYSSICISEHFKRKTNVRPRNVILVFISTHLNIEQRWFGAWHWYGDSRVKWAVLYNKQLNWQLKGNKLHEDIPLFEQILNTSKKLRVRNVSKFRLKCSYM